MSRLLGQNILDVYFLDWKHDARMDKPFFGIDSFPWLRNTEIEKKIVTHLPRDITTNIKTMPFTSKLEEISRALIIKTRKMKYHQ